MTTIVSDPLSIWTGSTNVIDPGTGELRSSAGQLRRVQLAAAAVLSRPGRCTRQHYTFSAVPLTTTLALGTLTQVHNHEGDGKDAVGGGRVNKYCLLYHNPLVTSHTAAITIPATHHSVRVQGAVCV